MNAPQYLNVPSTGAITKSNAYAIARVRWQVNIAEARRGYAGIAWQGNHGTARFATWEELPEPTRANY